MSKVVTMQDIKNKKIETVEWKYYGTNKDGAQYPLKVWENLECLLNKHGIKPRLNLINHEVDYDGYVGSEYRNSKQTDIHSLQVREGLNLSRDEVALSIQRIAENNQYNPFVDMLKDNKNNNYNLIKEVFECLELHPDNADAVDYYATIFTKWCLNVVKMAQNTLQKDWSSQGVLVLQGGQGCFKSTFSRMLMSNKDWYKGDKSLDPEKTDSVIQNTNYILVEWGELDSTMKAEQSKLKQFITSTNDEYRSPYARLPEKYPRITSYIGTVNKVDFLKDETGSRRFWIIPVQKCNIDKLKNINIDEFWGAVYDLWLTGTVTDYLTEDEQAILSDMNKNYAYENDITIAINEKIDWTRPEEEWTVYNITELAEHLFLKEKKSLKIEMLKLGHCYKSYRIGNGKTKNGFKVPRFEVSLH